MYEVTIIKSKINKRGVTTELPYIPRIGDTILIYTDDEEELIKGVVSKVMYFENKDTRENGEPNFDIFVE
jgi:hypothetical protein